MTKYFVYLSGEQTSIAKAEVDVLSQLLGIDERYYWDGRIGLIDSQKSPVSFFINRAALVKETGLVISETHPQDLALGNLSDEMLKEHIKPKETFSVRTISDNSDISVSDRLSFESSLGARIKKVVGAKVNLERPQVRIIVIISQETIRICKSVASNLRPILREREPGQKQFFHPSMMNATLSRVMCNLVGLMPDEILLDPFCGGGGILCEAAHIGAKTVGIDLNWRLLSGSKKNLTFTGSDYSIIQGDTRSLPVRSCDCIVTDPPYGKASSTRGANAVELVESLFSIASSILARRDGSICICGSSEMNIQDIAGDIGLIVEQVHQIKVHSGLIREVLTLGV
ncbi:MAG: THUMP domain-containing protein [Candidatus Thorarchaeota archaeon]